jgi:beta-phosphoglucomutase-like phosphatase (HAD superfamily)
MAIPSAILDVDGTLVDTNYQHAVAWYRAFRRHGIVLPVWRVHRHIGMGGDQIVASLCGAETEERLGDDVRAAEADLYMELIDEVEPLPGARDLIVELKRGGHNVVLPAPRRSMRSIITWICSTRARSWTAGPRRPTYSARSPTPTSWRRASGRPAGETP